MSRSGGVSCCFLFSPGPFFDGFVSDLLFTFLLSLMEEAAQAPASAVCRNAFPALGVDFHVCTYPCTSAVGGHGVVCQRQVLHRGFP